MNMNLSEKISEILERDLYGYNEGCTGTNCVFFVKGKERASKALEDLFRQYLESEKA